MSLAPHIFWLLSRAAGSVALVAALTTGFWVLAIAHTVGSAASQYQPIKPRNPTSERGFVVSELGCVRLRSAQRSVQ
jgi:hypothetical protein